MTNHRTQNSDGHDIPTKRKKVLAAVAQEIVTSEDDDNIADGMDICDIVEGHTAQHKQTTTSSAIHTLGETIRNTLLEINEIREQNRERRHRELLQILTRMVQQESSSKNQIFKSNITNLKQQNITNQTNDTDACNYTAEQDLLENPEFCIETVQADTVNISTSGTFANNLNVEFDDVNNQQFVDCDKTSTKYIKILPNSQSTISNSNQQQLGKIKNVITVKSNNTKEELQKMRAKMLEIQRQKMEDRERKKREFLQLQKTKN